MKKLFLTLAVLAFFAMQALAYDFQSGNLLYSIISANPPRVSVAGHVDGESAQGELDIPSWVTYEDVTYTVTEIGEWAFKNCTGLTGQLYFPATIDTIREGAFYGCSGFTGTLDLSFSTVVFKENVFRNCTGFTELYLPLFISEIPRWLFCGCSGLTGTLALPETVEIIGVGAFAQCSGFTGLVLPNGLREIRENAFSECSGFTGNLVFPETVTHIKIGAFHNCTGFSGNLVIPQAIIELGTENTSGSFNGSFEGCTGFTGLVLGESLEKIGCVCFRDCTGFTGPLVLPEGLKEIWTCAFQGCSGFTGALAFPSSLTFIGSNAFEACIGFSGTLVIPETIENVQSYAFAACTGIENVILPQQYVFQNTDVTTMGVFEGCTGLTSIDIPEGWEYTVPWMFEDCSNLVSVHLPESLRRISAYCFSYCTSLSEINVAEGLKEIGQAAFLGCTSLAEFDFRNLTNIRENAFSHCVNLTSPSGDLIIPDSLESIKFRSFDSCVGFHRLVIGTRVNHIEESAFNHTEFESIVMRTEVPPTLSRINILSNWHFPNDIPITVPCGTLEAYLNDEVWSEFTNISEDCGGLPTFNGSEWYYEILNENGSITYQHLEYAADTTVNGKTVVIIIRTNTLYDKDEHTEVTREYVYEENGVVYWWNKDLQEFTTLYDFGAEVGDEWEIKVGLESITMHVDSVRYYEYNGEQYKTLTVSDENDIFSGNIVCGVGHLTSFFPERLMTQGKAYRVEGIRCYWREGELVFKYGDKDCDEVYEQYHHGLDEMDDAAFAVYPNPTDGIITVSGLQSGAYRITNIVGQTVLTGSIDDDNQRIDVSALPKGMYFITVGDTTRKFVLK